MLDQPETAARPAAKPRTRDELERERDSCRRPKADSEKRTDTDS